MSSAHEINDRFVVEARKTLATMHGKIVHCVGQLSDEDLNWRAFAGANSIGNLVTHLCGNVTQWIIDGVCAGFDGYARGAVAAVGAGGARGGQTIAGMTAETALSPRRIQGFDETALSAIFHAVTHFEGHTHQIVYITRLRLGERYRFKWVPTTPEQVSGEKP